LYAVIEEYVEADVAGGMFSLIAARIAFRLLSAAVSLVSGEGEGFLLFVLRAILHRLSLQVEMAQGRKEGRKNQAYRSGEGGTSNSLLGRLGSSSSHSLLNELTREKGLPEVPPLTELREVSREGISSMRQIS
jgi:uncharacterized membrane protein YgcG